jgi:hypothetical protein
MLGGPISSDGRVDAFKIFNENNSDILQMNSLIREHMNNIQQVASAYNNMGVLGPSNIGVVVNNFDSSPNDPTPEGADKDKKPIMTPHHVIFGTNQKTPMPARNFKDMKENLEASAAGSSAIISAASMSVSGRMACAPQKGIDDSSLKGDSSNSHIKDIDNKFGEDLNGD